VSVQYYGIAGLAKECAVLLSAMARNGSDSEVEIQKAFETGAATLDLPQDIQLLPDSECNLPQIDSALDKFMTASMPVRNLLLRACSFAAATDGLLEEHEAELLRAIADSLECPLPPILPAENTGSAAR